MFAFEHIAYVPVAPQYGNRGYRRLLSQHCVATRLVGEFEPVTGDEILGMPLFRGRYFLNLYVPGCRLPPAPIEEDQKEVYQTCII